MTFAEIGSVGANVTAYRSGALAAGTGYAFRVRAYNADGASDYSGTATAVTQAAASPPAAPSALVATPVSTTQIDLAWADNSANEVGFRIERAPGGSTTFAEIGTVGANVVRFQDTGLGAGTGYAYRVRAHNAAGPSDYSGTASAVTLSNAPSLQAPVIASDRITLTWTFTWPALVSTNDAYLLEESTAGPSTGFSQIGAYDPGTTRQPSYSVTLTRAPGTYYYRVRARVPAGLTGYSQVQSAVVSQLTVTLRPQYDNTVMISSTNAALANTVYQSGSLPVGCNWVYNDFLGIQDFVCAESLMRFDLAALAGRTIVSAELTLTVDQRGVGYYPRNWHLWALATAWNPATVTWNAAAGFFHYTATTIVRSPPSYAGQVYAIDLTSYVRNWVSQAWNNHGMVLGSESYLFPFATSFDVFSFFSREDPGQDGPTLTITYR